MRICNKSSKRAQNNNHIRQLPFFFVLCVSFFLLAGCGGKGKQWGQVIGPELHNEAVQGFTQMSKRDEACPATMVADLAITYSSPLINRSVSGYLQFSLPEDYKFVVTNPLGQIFWGVAGNRKQYQTVNTAKRIYATGELKTLVLKHQLPIFLVQHNWGDWLMARSRFHSSRIIDIRHDNENRGVWFTVKSNILQGSYEHLLIDLKHQLLLQRILSDHSGDHLATITYSRINKKTDNGQCIQPEHISITGLDYGSNIELQLSAIEFQPEKKSYQLPRPPQYQQVSVQ